MKITAKFDDKSCDVQLDLERQTTAESLSGLLKDAFRIPQVCLTFYKRKNRSLLVQSLEKFYLKTAMFVNWC